MQISPSYTLVNTEDGSPSLEYKNPEGYVECMHHRLGAFSETNYIYKPVLEEALKASTTPTVMSVGLGLGYVEMLWAGFSIANKVETTHLDSFEIDSFLRENFLGWVANQEQPLSKTYDVISARWEELFQINLGSIRTYLEKAVENQSWRLFGELSTQTPFDRKFNGFFFDPFSKKANPSLWTPEFLSRFFTEAAAPKCNLSTYAAQGELKRQLRAHGFELQVRPGFAGKRESTFAIR